MRLALVGILSLLGCNERSERAQVLADTSVTVTTTKVEIVKVAPELTVEAAAQSEVARGGRDVVIYVGATWCEPCERFKDEAQRGGLDAVFPRLTLLEFDRDRDEAKLGAAGCLSELIPLFALPAADGTCDPERRIMGSVKGDGAVANITPRLKSLLGTRVDTKP